MINFDDYTNENKTEHSSKWPYIQIIHKEYSLLVVRNQEKQMHY